MTEGLSNRPSNDRLPFGLPVRMDVKREEVHARALMERCPLFSGLLPAELTRLLACGRLKQFARGEIMQVEGDTVHHVVLLTRGLVKITQLGMRGVEVILRLSIPGEIVGAVSLFASGKHLTTAQAFRACHAVVWDSATFRSSVERSATLHQNLTRIVVGQLAELEARFREVATERVAPRVACQLIRMAERIGRPVDGAIEIGLSREELAQMTGTTLFTISRLLSSWQEKGFVKPLREAVAICDFQSLSAIGEGR